MKENPIIDDMVKEVFILTKLSTMRGQRTFCFQVSGAFRFLSGERTKGMIVYSFYNISDNRSLSRGCYVTLNVNCLKA